MFIDEILDRLKDYLHIESESKLARALGVRPQNVKNWRVQRQLNKLISNLKTRFPGGFFIA